MVVDKREVERVCEAVAGILREERERRGLAMLTVAERAGVSQQMVSYVERGIRRPTLEMALRIAKAIGVELAEVLVRAEKLSGGR